MYKEEEIKGTRTVINSVWCVVERGGTHAVLMKPPYVIAAARAEEDNCDLHLPPPHRAPSEAGERSARTRKLSFFPYATSTGSHRFFWNKH